LHNGSFGVPDRFRVSLYAAFELRGYNPVRMICGSVGVHCLSSSGFRAVLTSAALLLFGTDLNAWPISNPAYHTGYPQALASADSVARGGSVAVASIDASGTPVIIVGTVNGTVEVYNADGTLRWKHDLGPTGISSKPAVGDLHGDGNQEIVVSTGSTSTVSTSAGVYILDSSGNSQKCWDEAAQSGAPLGVYSTPALAALNPNRPGTLNIVFGTWSEHILALNDDCSIYWDVSVRNDPASSVDDTVFSSAAIGDIDGDGQLEVVIGADHTNGNASAFGDGGLIHAFRHDGSAELSGFPIFVDEVVSSSPALADLDGDGKLDIVVGTGECWEISACAGSNPSHPIHAVTDAVYAYNYLGQPVHGWPVSLDDPGPTGIRRYAYASPAIADLDGNGTPSVIINAIAKNIVSGSDTQPASSNGWTYVFNADGSTRAGWPKQPVTPGCHATYSFGARVSPIIADLDGDHLPEIILPSNDELVVWDRNGNQLSRSQDLCGPTPPGYALDTASGGQTGSPALGDVSGSGSLTLVETGQTAFNTGIGAIYAWDFNSASASDALTAWPGFRNNSANTAVWRPETIFKNDFD